MDRMSLLTSGYCRPVCPYSQVVIIERVSLFTGGYYRQGVLIHKLLL